MPTKFMFTGTLTRVASGDGGKVGEEVVRGEEVDFAVGSGVGGSVGDKVV